MYYKSQSEQGTPHIRVANEELRNTFQEEKLELQPEFNRKLAKCIQTAGKTGELNFMMEGLTYFPMGVFQEEVQRRVTLEGLEQVDLRVKCVDLGKL